MSEPGRTQLSCSAHRQSAHLAPYPLPKQPAWRNRPLSDDNAAADSRPIEFSLSAFDAEALSRWSFANNGRIYIPAKMSTTAKFHAKVPAVNTSE